MNLAMKLSASGMLTSMYRQDVAANNLANVDTVGFKPDMAATRQRDVVAVEDGVMDLPSNRLLERLGSGVLLEPNRISQAQGPIETTSNPLDVAVRGSGFLAVEIGSGEDAERLRLTRDGRMTLNSEGWLVQSTTGFPVLDRTGSRIRIDQAAGPVSISPSGVINQGSAEVATLQFVDVPNPQQLRKTGNGFFQATSEQLSSLTQARGRIEGSAIERSGVDPIKAIMGITDAAGDVSSNSRIMQLADELMGRLINSVGRF